MSDTRFKTAFQALTNTAPFPWQTALYQRFVEDRPGNIPRSCNIPTGLGKTSVIAIWLIALATHPEKMPRRLVYVVNRRTVVDQTTTEVEKIAKQADAAAVPKIAISTLRGQFADNRSWSADPSKPAVICGTVDMIGSRLLFSGYGVGFKGKPLHAGFLGQDVLLVHDEAHLEPAFQSLLQSIEDEQTRCKEFGRFQVMELSATSRGQGKPFGLSDADREHPIVAQRITAPKHLRFFELKDQRKLADQVADLALAHQDSGRAILVFVQRVDDVEKIAGCLRRADQNVQQLTGTLRGLERDALAESDQIFARFLPKPKVEHKPGTVYLICTSAGEVGVNISADHLVCDLSTFDSMAQRFGRVNRFGERRDTQIDIVHPTEFEDDDRCVRLERTLALLQELRGDGSPQALAGLDPDARIAAFAPTPTILPTTDILFDAWALTTIREKLPGRPPVAPYLQGIRPWEPPITQIAWRDEVNRITGDLLVVYKPKDLLEDFPLKPHELLRDSSNRVFKHLAQLAELHPGDFAWLIDQEGKIEVVTLELLADKNRKDRIDDMTVVLAPSSGGLDKGLLNGHSTFAEDVSDKWYVDVAKSEKRRLRLWDGAEEPANLSEKYRLVREIELPNQDDEEAEPRIWRWYVRPKSADDDASKTASLAIAWHHHTNDVVSRATQFADALLKGSPDLHQALVIAARFHDLGKMRLAWQHGIGNPQPSVWYAKSGKDPKSGRIWKSRELTTYRHELGSLIDIEKQLEFKTLTEDQKDLVCHLIAVHHGYGRPHFPVERVFDPERSQSAADDVASKTSQRYARLQRKYGRWGLAYLESLLRAADWAASAEPSKEEIR